MELKNEKVAESKRKGKEKRERRRKNLREISIFINYEITDYINLSLVLCIYITQ